MKRTGASVLRVSGALAVLAALGLLGCSDEQAAGPEPEPQGSGSAVPTENAKLLDSAASAALRAFSQEGEVLELEFGAKVGVLTELAAGDALIIGPTAKTPNGALVLVEDTVESAEGFAVRGRPAALREAFEELHLKLDTVLIAPPANEAQSAPELGTSRQALGLAFPFEISAGSGANSITLDGSLAVDPSIALNLSFDFAKFQLDELSLSFSAKETLTANLVGQGEKTFEETLSLGSIPFAPITIFLPTPIGAIPIVLTPGIVLQAGLRGGIRGDVEASVTQRASFTAGLGYKNGKFGGFSEHDSDFDVEEPTYEASANVKAWAGPKLEVLIYGVVGPFAGVQGFVEAAANLEGPPVCVTGTLDAGLTATAGMTFLADYSTTLFEAREELASFDTCSKDANAPRPALTWARTFGRAGSDGEKAQAVLQVSDGGYFVLGQSDSFGGTGGFGAATWALRLDALGNVLWQRAYERAEQGLARGAAEVADGFVIAGTQGLIKVDVGGNVVWAKQYDTEELLELTSVTATADGGLVLAGTYGNVAQAFAMGVDADGEPSWARQFAGSDFRRVRATKDGGVVLAGSIVEDNPDFYLVKLDARGDVQWQRALNNEFNTAPAGEEPIPTSSNDAAYDVIERPQGGFVVAGESYGNFPIPMPTPLGYYAAAVLELDERGDLTGAGSKLYRAPADSLYGSAYAVAVRANGSPVVLGRHADTAEQLLVDEDVLLLQNGTFSVFGSGGNDSVYSGTLAGVGRGQPLLLTADGGAIVAVTSNSFAPQKQEQIWLLKLNRTASIDSPYRGSTPGAAFSAADATSTELTASTSSVEVQALPLSAAVESEVTELTGTLQ